MKKAEAQTRLLQTLSRHVGVEKALGMAELFELVYGRPVADRINDTRVLRKIITSLRLGGAPIASVSRPDGGGYYLAGRRIRTGRLSPSTAPEGNESPDPGSQYPEHKSARAFQPDPDKYGKRTRCQSLLHQWIRPVWRLPRWWKPMVF